MGIYCTFIPILVLTSHQAQARSELSIPVPGSAGALCCCWHFNQPPCPWSVGAQLHTSGNQLCSRLVEPSRFTPGEPPAGFIPLIIAYMQEITALTQPAAHLPCKGARGVTKSLAWHQVVALYPQICFLFSGRSMPDHSIPLPPFPGKPPWPAPSPLPARNVPGLIGYQLLQALKDEKPSTGEVLSVHGLLMVSHHYFTFQGR